MRNRHHDLAREWVGLRNQIRKLDGFSSFLRRTPYHILQQAAIGGPVILMHVNEKRSDAIIVPHTGFPVVVPLFDTNPKSVVSLSESMKGALAMEPGEEKRTSIADVLAKLWEQIVKPIVAALDKLPAKLYAEPKGSGQRRRIWWCPTQELWSLPLHVAGLYGADIEVSVQSRYIDSD